MWKYATAPTRQQAKCSPNQRGVWLQKGRPANSPHTTKEKQPVIGAASCGLCRMTISDVDGGGRVEEKRQGRTVSHAQPNLEREQKKRSPSHGTILHASFGRGTREIVFFRNAVVGVGAGLLDQSDVWVGFQGAVILRILGQYVVDQLVGSLVVDHAWNDHRCSFAEDRGTKDFNDDGGDGMFAHRGEGIAFVEPHGHIQDDGKRLIAAFKVTERPGPDGEGVFGAVLEGASEFIPDFVLGCRDEEGEVEGASFHHHAVVIAHVAEGVRGGDGVEEDECKSRK